MVRTFGLLIVAIGGLAAIGQAPKSADAPTYHQDIAPVIAKSCLPCHRENGVAPFSLATYSDVKRRASLVQFQVLSQAMPPHRIRSDFGHLAEALPFTDAEAVTLQNWLRAGTPEGEPVSVTQSTSSGWQLGRPDLILKLRQAIEVPADKSPYWQLHTIKLPYETGRRLRAVDLRPMSPKALRSATFGLASLRGVLNDGAFLPGSFDFMAETVFGAWAAGFRPWSAPKGTGIDVDPRFDSLAILTHYRPTGKIEDGGFELALYFDREAKEPNVEVKTIGVDEFVIEADKSLALESSLDLSADKRLITVIPEARFFASRYQIEATLPNGERKTIFETLRWNPYWSGNYGFSDPPTLPKGTRIVARVTYDNDERCTANEGKKPQRVVSGPKLTDEVFRVHLVFTSPSQHK